MKYAQQAELVFEGLIWNILFNPKNSLAVFEMRSKDPKQVYFLVVDLQENKIISEKISFEENWWVVAKYFLEDKIVFFKYKVTTTPQQDFFFVYDISQKNILWQSQEPLYDCLYAQNALVCVYQHPQIVSEMGFQLLNLDDGVCVEVLNNYKSSDDANIGQFQEYAYQSEYYGQVHKFLEKQGIFIEELLVESSVFYAENEYLMAIGKLHAEQFWVYLFEPNGKFIKSLSFQSGSVKNIAQAFFLHKKMLIFLANENKIINFAI